MCDASIACTRRSRRTTGCLVYVYDLMQGLIPLLKGTESNAMELPVISVMLTKKRAIQERQADINLENI